MGYSHIMVGRNNNKVYKLVLTGGPCGGKTTGQARLCSFFETLGWKVYRVPETATVLIGGGVKFAELAPSESYRFQENLVKTMMQIENAFFDLAASCRQNCLVICDRGTMDASAYLKPEDWERMKTENNWNSVDLRDSRYNQVIHMVSAAKGAPQFYRTDTHVTRSEDLGHAQVLDGLTSHAWVGHPYYDVIDNSTDFERKIVRMVATVCQRLGVNPGWELERSGGAGCKSLVRKLLHKLPFSVFDCSNMCRRDRLNLDSKKRKFVVKQLPPELIFSKKVSSEKLQEDMNDSSYHHPQFQDFIVIHDYLVTPSNKMQARIRRRGQNVRWDAEKGRWDTKTGNWTYTHTIRRPEINSEAPELKMQISAREYELLLAQRDANHHTVFKKRRCFLWENKYFQMDIYQSPCTDRCKDLIILETYTTLKGEELTLPDFLEIEREITDCSDYSMFNLSKVSTKS